jgi:hypothetical protein
MAKFAGWDGNTRTMDGVRVLRTRDGNWMVVFPRGRRFIRHCQSCGELSPTARAAQRSADDAREGPASDARTQKLLLGLCG